MNITHHKYIRAFGHCTLFKYLQTANHVWHLSIVCTLSFDLYSYYSPLLFTMACRFPLHVHGNTLTHSHTYMSHTSIVHAGRNWNRIRTVECRALCYQFTARYPTRIRNTTKKNSSRLSKCITRCRSVLLFTRLTLYCLCGIHKKANETMITILGGRIPGMKNNPGLFVVVVVFVTNSSSITLASRANTSI